MRFVDSNPRPSKSPRHVAPPEVPSNYADYPTTRFGPPYSGSNNDPLPSRGPEYFPPAMQPWTSSPETGVVYGTASQAPGVQHYEFPNDQYGKEEGGSGPPHYTWNPT